MQHLTLIGLLCTFCMTASSQSLSKEEEAYTDSMMNAYYKPDAPGAVLLIAKEGQPVYRKAFGMASLELNVPNKVGSVFKIGSMSKQFTAVGMLKLAQEGKLHLQDDIRKYLPDYNSHGRAITIENILTHTSGIVDAQDKAEFLKTMRIDQSHEDLLKSFMADSLLFEPGTDWHYSNPNYELAGFIIEKVSGMPLREYLQQNIFQPLQMTHTQVLNNDSIFVDLTNGYDKIAGKYRPAVYLSNSWSYAAGDIVSNVDDLLKWDNALYTDQIVKQEWLQKARKPYVLKNGASAYYGFGWSINKNNGMQIIEHAGGVNGFNSDGIRIPSLKLYVAILSNNTAYWSPAIATPIATHLAGVKLPKAAAYKTNKKDLAAYTGVYALKHPGGNTSIDTSSGRLYTYITVANDTLYVQPASYAKAVLFQVDKDVFVTEYGNPYYKFHRNRNGKIVSAEIYNQPIQTGPAEVRVKTNQPLPVGKKSITLSKKQLEVLKGRYDFGGGAVAPVIVEGDKIYFQMEEKFEMLAEDETHFFFKTVDGTAEFIKTGERVRGVIVTRGAKYEGKKIE